MPDSMDVQRLIAEVKVRPTLWDVRFSEYKDRFTTPQLWQEIADILEIDVEHCKRKWKNLRDAYRAEVRRTERRVECLKASGHYDLKMCMTSKWIYFEPMSFISVSKRSKYALAPSAPDHSSGSLDNSMNEQIFHNFCGIKIEPTNHTTDEDDHDLEDDENEMLFEEFQLVATPQATRRLSNSITLANAADDAEVEENRAVSTASAADSGAGVSTRSGVPTACKCSTRADDQVHFLESLKREEQQLMQSTRQDMTRADTLSHVGDADYNFLVSFLPQMKKMSELQNLQFRAKMSDQLLRIMTPSSSATAVVVAATTADKTTTAAVETTMAVGTHLPMIEQMESSETSEN